MPKISQLPAGGTPQAADIFPIVRNGQDYTIAVGDLPKGFTAPVTITGVTGQNALTITDPLQVASFPAINVSQTWNNAAAAFTGLLFNVTNTASAAGSLLLDLQVGGASRISIGATNGSLSLGADAVTPVAQTISAPSVMAGTTNTAGANLIFAASRGTGLGNGGAHVFQTAPAGATGSAQNALATRMTIAGAGNVTIAAPTSGATLGLTTVSGASGLTIATASTDPTPGLVVGIQGAGPAISNFPGLATFWQNSNTGQNPAINLVETLNGSGLPPAFNFYKIRNNFGSVGATEVMGLIQFFGSDGTAAISSAMISAVVDTAPSAGVMPSRLVFYTAATNVLVERLRINSTGNHTFAAPSSGVTMTVSPLAGQNAIVTTGAVKLGSFTVAGLPAAATVGAGSRAFVTDSTVVAAGNFGNIVAGTGANFCPVYSDGTNWRIG